MAKHYDKLSSALFKLFPSPMIRAQFAYTGKKWQLQSVGPIAASEIPGDHRPFVIEVAEEYFQSRRNIVTRRETPRFQMAILYDPKEETAPSNGRAIQKFVKAAESLDFGVEIIGKDDYARLAEFDALFIRETTAVNHHTFRFSRRAAAEGLVVIDDPGSILRCGNKVFLAEVLERHKIQMPRTRILSNVEQADIVAQDLGLPCILKQPDSAFSMGVHKVHTVDQMRDEVARLLAVSDLIIAQEFLPTDFDWRVGVLDGQPLYVCRYFMATDHWQIVKRDPGTEKDYGKVETLLVETAPQHVVKAALKAASLMGNGLYGVDLKEIGGKACIIEINDNPNIDAGFEDAILKDELYAMIMRVLLRRVEKAKERR
jgi:glutathione synthase/RimK-type ligase-like ATP-grasp enzyme